MARWPHERSLVTNLANKPFVLIGVHIKYDNDDVRTVKRVMVKEQLNWRSFVDKGPISDKWKPGGTPAYYVIDPKGVIRYKWAGAPGAKAIDTALEAVLQETEKGTK